MANISNELKHSVAFRVSEQEWRKLQQEAKKFGTSVPQLAKRALFQKIGVDYEPKAKAYGQSR